MYGFGGWGILLYLAQNWSEIQSRVGVQWKYLGGPFFLLGALLLYFIPWMVAATRGHKEITPIFLVNLLLGWTFIGWVVALIWSTTSNVTKKESVNLMLVGFFLIAARAEALDHSGSYLGDIPLTQNSSSGYTRPASIFDFDFFVYLGTNGYSSSFKDTELVPMSIEGPRALSAYYNTRFRDNRGVLCSQKIRLSLSAIRKRSAVAKVRYKLLCVDGNFQRVTWNGKVGRY